MIYEWYKKAPLLEKLLVGIAFVLAVLVFFYFIIPIIIKADIPVVKWMVENWVVLIVLIFAFMLGYIWITSRSGDTTAFYMSVDEAITEAIKSCNEFRKRGITLQTFPWDNYEHLAGEWAYIIWGPLNNDKTETWTALLKYDYSGKVWVPEMFEHRPTEKYLRSRTEKKKTYQEIIGQAEEVRRAVREGEEEIPIKKEE